MAARLITQKVAGTEERPLYVWNRSKAKCTAFKEAFPDSNVIISESAKEVVEACSITYSMLSTPEASAAVFEGDAGVLSGVSEGKGIVDCATLAEKDHQNMSSKVSAAGGLYLEAPVSGSKGPAETGALVFLCGGSADLFHMVEDGLAAMGKAQHFLGEEVGVGTRAKLVRVFLF